MKKGSAPGGAFVGAMPAAMGTGITSYFSGSE
jgi:hypothetical protein